jgi:hypothetical protein
MLQDNLIVQNSAELQIQTNLQTNNCLSQDNFKPALSNSKISDKYYL